MNEMTNWQGNPYPLEAVLNGVGAGWHNLVSNLIGDLFALGWDGHLNQIKEKFGGLRFYIGIASDEVHERISLAEKESYHTCDMCGKPGKRRSGGWVRTLCDEHAQGRDYEDWVD